MVVFCGNKIFVMCKWSRQKHMVFEIYYLWKVFNFKGVTIMKEDICFSFNSLYCDFVNCITCREVFHML